MSVFTYQYAIGNSLSGFLSGQTNMYTEGQLREGDGALVAVCNKQNKDYFPKAGKIKREV